jgi:hypothetical protein
VLVRLNTLGSMELFRWATRGRLLAPWLLALGVSACFYDHRVTQAIQERRRRAREAEGARIGTSGAASSVKAQRVGRLRFYVAEGYRRQHPAWKRDLEDLVERANGVLGPSFGLRLEVSELNAWAPVCDANELESCLDELATHEPADEREWLVGVLPALPRFTTRFDELGVARVPGHHFVLRDVSDPVERAADAAFPAHTQAQRDDIYARRKEHKRLAVFLHEWAHALGALHAVSADGLLHPSYDDRMADFDPANAGLVHAALDDAFSGESGHAALLAELSTAPADSFVAGERDALVARLEAAEREAEESEEPEPAEWTAEQRAQAAPAAHPFVVQGREDELLAGFAAAERGAYREAVRLVDADPEQALAALTPLVAQHPESYAVQHLACGLTMQLGHQADMQATCARAQSLALKRQ